MQQIFAAIHFMHKKGIVDRYAHFSAGKSACIDLSPATIELLRDTFLILTFHQSSFGKDN